MNSKLKMFFHLKIGILVSLLFNCSLTESQTIKKYYQFKVLKPVGYDSVTNKWGKELEFIIHRDSINDREYIDYGLIDKDTNLGYKFMIVSKNWLIKCPNDTLYNIFYSGDTGQIGHINISGIIFDCYWKTYNLSKNFGSFILSLEPPENVGISHLPKFIFNEKDGIIGLIGQEYIFIREDRIMYFID